MADKKEKQYVSNNAQLMSEWDLEKNLTFGFSPSSISYGSGLKVWWICPKGHSYQTTVNKKVSRNAGCPICSGHKTVAGINDFATYYPELSKEWHPTKNGDLLPSNVSAGTNKKAWWIGKCGHEWEASISSRNAGRDCPYCASQKLLVGFNDLATKNPKLAKEWHPTKNGDRLPRDYMANSNTKVWWK